VTSAPTPQRRWALLVVAACIALSWCWAIGAAGAGGPPASKTAPKPATKPAATTKPGVAANAGESMKPIDIATRARVFEEQGAYASALAELKTLRSVEAPDPDVELAVALDEAMSALREQ